MSRRVRKTAQAEKDIMGIAKWIARDSLDAALNWLDELDEKLQKLAEMPGTGTDRSDLRRGMRSSPFGQYLVFFKSVKGGIQIVRVIHGARDYGRFFRRT